MRTLSLSVYQATDPTDRLHVEYGMSGESVDYVQHVSRVSPFARVSVSAGVAGEWIAAYSDGARPDALLRHSNSARNIETENMNDDRVDGNTSSARLPLLSRRHGRLKLQRTQNAEIGFRKELGSRTYAASVFRETVWNGRINVSGDLSGLESGDLLSDSLSATSTYNIGNYRRSGYIVSADQKLGDNANLTLAYGRMGGFGAYAPSAGAWNRSNSLLVENSENIAAVNVKMAVPLAGTQLSGDYGWVSHGTVIPQHVFTTQNTSLSPGLNICLRQPLPPLFGWGRLELTASVRNLLAQGYLPFDTGQGQLLIVQSPRTVRGGLNFIF
jgi:hypothetical protein